MKLVIPGGSGQVGTILTRHYSRGGHEVVVLSRAGDAPPGARGVRWDGRSLGSWASEVDGADVVINLAGRSVDCRYNAANRREIMNSRIESTRAVGQAIASAEIPPPVWLQASTATIYAHRYDAPNDEQTGLLGGAEPDAPDAWRFSIDVARSWEDSAVEAAAASGTRLVLMRSAMIMSPDHGGIFDTLLRLVRFRLGGTAGGGRQFVSWIHHDDFARAVEWLVGTVDVSGPVNLAAPDPVPNGEFMRALRQAWGTRIGLPAARWMLEAGATLMRTETELVLKSRRVIPGVLLARGFRFEHPYWPPAARELVTAWRAAR